MKKKILLVLLSACLLTGCTKNYKSTDEYLNAMTDVRNKLGDYTIEATMASSKRSGYYKSHIKGDLWKTEESKDNGQTYKGTILYDGDEVFAYSVGQPVAVSMYLKKSLEKNGIHDEEKARILMNLINPMGLLFYWNINLQTGDADPNWEMGKITKMNVFYCRMFKNTKEGSEVCVSDKYGIAIYAKRTEKTRNETIEINVKNIDNKTLTLADVELPPGVKKISISDLFKDMAKMMKQ